MNKYSTTSFLSLLIVVTTTQSVLCKSTQTLEKDAQWFHLYDQLVLKPREITEAKPSQGRRYPLLFMGCLVGSAIAATAGKKKIALLGGFVSYIGLVISLLKVTREPLSVEEKKAMVELLNSLPNSSLPEEVNIRLMKLKNLLTTDSESGAWQEELRFLKAKCFQLYPDPQAIERLEHALRQRTVVIQQTR